MSQGAGVRLQSLTRLYWSIRGEVACVTHSPEPDDPRWFIEGWQLMPSSSADSKPSRYQCQHCSPDGRAIVHRVRVFLH